MVHYRLIDDLAVPPSIDATSFHRPDNTSLLLETVPSCLRGSLWTAPQEARTGMWDEEAAVTVASKGGRRGLVWAHPQAGRGSRGSEDSLGSFPPWVQGRSGGRWTALVQRATKTRGSRVSLFDHMPFVGGPKQLLYEVESSGSRP